MPGQQQQQQQQQGSNRVCCVGVTLCLVYHVQPTDDAHHGHVSVTSGATYGCPDSKLHSADKSAIPLHKPPIGSLPSSTTARHSGLLDKVIIRSYRALC